MLKIGSIVWGVRDVPRAIRFWSAALDYQPLREPSPDWAILIPRTGPGPQFAITAVTSDAEDHRRHHLDLYADDAAAEVERLIGLGAARAVALSSRGRLRRAYRSGWKRLLRDRKAVTPLARCFQAEPTPRRARP